MARGILSSAGPCDGAKSSHSSAGVTAMPSFLKGLPLAKSKLSPCSKGEPRRPSVMSESTLGSNSQPGCCQIL